MNKEDAIIITGPTASGKTGLSLALAQHLQGEVVCCDSMQIYRYMDIGTATPTAADQAKVKHHLFDIKDPDEKFSVSGYVDLARPLAKKLLKQEIVPIFCGGTGQYVTALAEGIEFIDIPVDLQLRKILEERYLKEGGESMLADMATFDSETAARLAPNDRKRIVRAFEVHIQSGQSLTEMNRRSKLKGPERKYHVFICAPEREFLYQRINERVEVMLELGLEDEVRNLFNRYPQPETALHTAIGYKEWLPYFDGQISRNEVQVAIAQYSRNYAKRQLTFMRPRKYAHWLRGKTIEERLAEILQIID